MPSINSTNRVPGVRLSATQERQVRRRRDKTGSRSYRGEGAGVRRLGGFQLQTYLLSRASGTVEPSCGPMLRSAMGGETLTYAGGAVDAAPSASEVRTTNAHGLVVGQGVAFGGEVRFVSSVMDSHTVTLNVPFSVVPTAGSMLGGTVSYRLGRLPKSVSLFDYWSPDSAVQRIVRGAVVDEFRIRLNGDFHELDFRGPACDVLDSASFSSGQAQLSMFPVEPAVETVMAQPVPGHLGQVWLGSVPEQSYTVTEAEFALRNRVDLRVREFGAPTARCFAPGAREVKFGFSAYGQDTASAHALYQASRQRSPIQVLLQLGQQAGQMLGVYMKSYLPEAPVFDDRENRLLWRFEDGLAEGTSDDEVYLAFA
ncbi:MAG: hypothetical protein SFV51_08880 [Bryobacteraceae bacterium]|nr:hypothetical protein [Bryobacteraceae bacterium]